VAKIKSKFRNVIVCEDIRDEMNGKKSLMGVFSGDIVVPSMPAVVRLAVYVEYEPDANDGNQVDFDFRLMQNATEMFRAHGSAPVQSGQSVVVALPPGLATFSNDTRFQVLASINKGEEIELVSKKIFQGSIATLTSAA
jgi:hypothetical protein